MAKRSVLSRPLPDSSLPRNTFDRSFFKNLNWSAGMLLPVFCQFVPAGSSGQINRSIFMRTNAVNTAAFPKLDTHIDFYKVPLKLLMTRYNEFKLNISDANSSSLVASGLSAPPSSMPFFNIGTIYGSYFGSGNSALDDVGLFARFGAERLLDLLGYNDEYIIRQGQTGSGLPNMNLQTFKLQAYQKVYYDHYRNTAYESNKPEAYNADYLYTGGTGNGEYGLNEFPDLVKIHYVNYRKDFFQNIYPALNYVVSSPNGLQWVIPSSVSGVSGLNSSTTPGTVFANSYSSGIGTIGAAVNSGSPDSVYVGVQQIRAAFALDKLLRLSAYAPKHVKDQLQARFGVKVSDASSYESQYLGSFMNDIVIGEVTATSAGSNTSGLETSLGQIGGRGVGAEQRGKDINFNVSGDDGDSIIIGMMYTLARSVYDSYRLDAFNFKFTREDIFVPEFMDLGLRPITLKEVYTPTSGALTLAQLNTIIGYVPRDQEYKLGVDENHGVFRSGEILSVFVNHTNVNVSQRGHTVGSPGVTLGWFKISPTDLDSIFAQNYNAQNQDTDQFFGHIEFKFISRQNMSVHGQPRL